MVSESNRNFSPATGIDSTLQARKRVRYVLPKGCIIGGSYCIEKPLGHGGMGEVYLARHMKLDIYRAIKILLPKIAVKDPVFATRFMREAKLAIQLQHPNIINVMDAEYDERLSIYYIVMEFVDGGTVRNLIRKNGPVDEQEVLKIVLHVGEALAVGEARKIVHRDIKPDNIMLTKDNVVKLADLGIAKSAADSNDVDVTSPEILIGTPAYVSPEQARDAQHVDSRADIYSLGVSMYEMLTGEKPYKGKTTVEILQQLFEAPVPVVRQKNQNVSKKVSDLVYRMMAKEKEKRPRNWKAFCKEVAKLLKEKSGYAGNETASTAVENLRDILPENKGIILGEDEDKPVIDKKKLKKAAKYSVVFGIAICFLLVSGVFSSSNLAKIKNSIALGLIGNEYRKQCEAHQLTPPWEIVFASGALKQAWIDQNIPKTQQPEAIILSEKKTEPAPVVKENGTFVFHIKVSSEMKEWLKLKGYKLEVSGGVEHLKGTQVELKEYTNDTLVGELSVPEGKYELSMKLPGCKAIDCSVDLKAKTTQQIDISMLPIDATIKIECNMPDFRVRYNNSTFTAKEIKVSSLQNIGLSIEADGYMSYRTALKLQPGEVRTISAELKPIPKFEMDTENMRIANKLFEDKQYHKAEELYIDEAKKNNPEAMYKLGHINEHRPDYFSFGSTDFKKALEYYTMAAELGYVDAIFKVGYFHEMGHGTPHVNEMEALAWYKRGETYNHIPCLLKIGDFYKEKKAGLERDLDKALSYYLLCAEKGNAEAHFKVALIYEEKMNFAGTQAERDEYRKHARYHCGAAASQNWPGAKAKLRNL